MVRKLEVATGMESSKQRNNGVESTADILFLWITGTVTFFLNLTLPGARHQPFALKTTRRHC
jgi:hypothetical protein